MRKKLTPAFVARVTPADIHKEKTATPAEKKLGAHVVYWDTEQRGLGLLVLPSGKRAYVVQYRAAGRSRRMTLQAKTLTDARTQAEVLKGKVATGRLLNQPIDPLAERQKNEAEERRQKEAERRARETEATKSLKAITNEYMKRDGRKLRSADYRQKTFDRLVFPMLGDRPIDTLKRSEIIQLLDKIEDERGPSMAQSVLAYLSKVFNWHSTRDDDFLTPIRKGMARIKQGERARERTLTNDELRVVWRAGEATEGPFGRFIQFLLLTATRRNEAAMMVRTEILPEGNWIIPAERMKAKKEHVVPLSQSSRTILDGMPKLGRYVFTTNGRGPIRGFAKFKTTFDATVLAELRKQDHEAKPLPHWTLHDLRRTARSLMGKAKVLSEIAERCIAHVPRGVQGTYDRYAYLDEKREAFEKLAALIEIIITPKADNVTSLDERRARGVSQVPG
jgi:integrase